MDYFCLVLRTTFALSRRKLSDCPADYFCSVPWTSFWPSRGLLLPRTTFRPAICQCGLNLWFRPADKSSGGKSSSPGLMLTGGTSDMELGGGEGGRGEIQKQILKRIFCFNSFTPRISVFLLHWLEAVCCIFEEFFICFFTVLDPGSLDYRGEHPPPPLLK